MRTKTPANVGGRVPAWQWLNYQLVHLHGTNPSRASTALLPRQRWPAFWYASARLAKSYVARPFDGPTRAIFATDERFDAWRPLLAGDADLRMVVEGHSDLMEQPTLGHWLALLGERLEATA